MASKRSADPLTDLGALPRVEADLVVLETIAKGGMGKILLARQTSLAREVAVKTALDATANGITALVREAVVTGSLEPPSIVPVHVLGVDADGHPLLVMKCVEGVTWRTLLSDDAHPAWTTHLGATGDRLEANLAVLTTISRALELGPRRATRDRGVRHTMLAASLSARRSLADTRSPIGGKARPTASRQPPQPRGLSRAIRKRQWYTDHVATPAWRLFIPSGAAKKLTARTPTRGALTPNPRGVILASTAPDPCAMPVVAMNEFATYLLPAFGTKRELARLEHGDAKTASGR